MVLLISLIYALSFIVLAVTMTVIARSSVPIFDRLPLIFLALFGYAHGTFDIVHIFQDLESLNMGMITPVTLDYLALFLLPLSFFFLLCFGIEFLIRDALKPKTLRSFYVILPLMFAIGSFFQFINHSSASWVRSVELISRYALGLPACIIATYSLWTLAKSRAREQYYKKYAMLLRYAGVVFFIYGLVVVVPGSNLRISNHPEHFTLFNPPLVLVRMTTMVLLSVLLARCFFIEILNVQQSLRNLQEKVTSLLAHDMKNLLTGIQLNSEMLLMRSTLQSINDRKNLESINKNTKMLSQLVADIFDTSLLDLKKIVLNFKNMNISEVINEVCGNAESIVNLHSLEVHAPETPVLANIDRTRMDQILMNLLSNAGKYSRPNTPILVNVKQLSGFVQVSVTSHGEYLTPEEQSMFFTLYYRAGSSVNKVRGTGLGLYIVKGLVEAHGGKVFVESTSDGVNTFGFVLPLSEGMSPGLINKFSHKNGVLMSGPSLGNSSV